MESLAKALKDVTKTFGVAKVFAVANQKQICKRQMASVKSEMASGKWEVGVKGQPALFNLMSSWILWQFRRKWNEISDTAAAAA